MVFSRLVNKNSSRSRRRWVVLGFYVGLALFAGLILDPDSESYVVVASVSLLVSMFILIALGSSIEVTGNFAEDLDERQQMVLDRAYRRAYQILSMALILVLFYLVLALSEHPEAQLWVPQLDRLNFIVIFVTFLRMGLPTTIMAWTEPDPEPEE